MHREESSLDPSFVQTGHRVQSAPSASRSERIETGEKNDPSNQISPVPPLRSSRLTKDTQSKIQVQSPNIPARSQDTRRSRDVSFPSPAPIIRKRNSRKPAMPNNTAPGKKSPPSQHNSQNHTEKNPLIFDLSRPQICPSGSHCNHKKTDRRPPLQQSSSFLPRLTFSTEKILFPLNFPKHPNAKLKSTKV